MKVSNTSLPGVLLIEPVKHGDHRGYFMETWRENIYADAGIADQFVQDNQSFSQRGILRGLHYQLPNPQGKLVYCSLGEVFDVAVDIRHGSPTFGQWAGFVLSADNARQVYIPPGFAHGFCVTSNHALFCYKCTEYYDAAGDTGILWNDKDLGIDWPLESVSTSEKDNLAPRLRDLSPKDLPTF